VHSQHQPARPPNPFWERRRERLERGPLLPRRQAAAAAYALATFDRVNAKETQGLTGPEKEHWIGGN